MDWAQNGQAHDGSHRVIRLTRGSPSATNGDIQIGEELTYVDDIEERNFSTESIEILLLGLPDSNVRLQVINLGGVGRDIFLPRVAWDKPSINWFKGGSAVQDKETRASTTEPPPERPGRPGTVEVGEAGAPPASTRRGSFPESSKDTNEKQLSNV